MKVKVVVRCKYKTNQTTSNQTNTYAMDSWTHKQINEAKYLKEKDSEEFVLRLWSKGKDSRQDNIYSGRHVCRHATKSTDNFECMYIGDEATCSLYSHICTVWIDKASCMPVKCDGYCWVLLLLLQPPMPLLPIYTKCKSFFFKTRQIPLPFNAMVNKMMADCQNQVRLLSSLYWKISLIFCFLPVFDRFLLCIFRFCWISNETFLESSKCSYNRIYSHIHRK